LFKFFKKDMYKIIISLLLIVVFASCKRNNVNDKPAYKALFDQYNMHGTFATYDNAFDEFNIYNLPRFRDSAYSPASTFKVALGMFGLENGYIIKNNLVKYNGNPNDSLKKDLKFNEALRTSSNWYFNDVIKQIGKDTLQRMLDSLNYGNKKIDTLPAFYVNNTLTIKPDEQMGFMKRIYFKQLTRQFSQRTMDAIKEAMEMEKTDKYNLCFKTGTTTGTNGKPLGWVVGWIETTGAKPKVNFFVLNAEGNSTMDDFIKNRPVLFKTLLQKEGLIK
jgi:beta-lactamase class D